MPDGSGYGECDCSSRPREANGGSSGEMGPTAYIGRACTETAQCGPGLTCFTSDSNDFLGGGPALGYCSTPCTADSLCTSIDPQSACVATTQTGNGLCLRTCLSLSPRSVAENKCLGRRELGCQSEAYRGITPFSGARQPGWCFPQCGSDEDCPGRFCDLARGICTDTAPTGLPIGARCEQNGDCVGKTCIGFGPDERFCSAPCVFGGQVGCGFGVGASTRGAACISPRVLGTLVGAEGSGDMGFCGELCATAAECEQSATRGWICDVSDNAQESFNRPGVCDAPEPGDAGADAGDGGDAAVDASGVSDGG